MTNTNPSESPLETVAEAVGEATIETLARLGNETRLAILLALWEAIDPGPPPSGGTISFSELRKRVGVQQGAQFNYHLDKLVGDLVHKSEHGYRLTPRAHHILQTVLGGTLTDPSSFDGGPIDETCPFCGMSAVVQYEDGALSTYCANCERSAGDGMVWSTNEFPSAGLDRRTPEEVAQAARTLRNHRILSLRAGACPVCAATVSKSLWVCADHDAAEGTHCEQCGFVTESLISLVCDGCRFWMHCHPFWFAYAIPEVRAFFHDHGIDLVSSGVPTDVLEYEVRSVDSPELRLRAKLDGDRIELTIDDDARVVEVTEATG